jgi:DNA (cytosine-5)-methyltransferase 1
MKTDKSIIGVDLFAGAGGMSLGAQMAGIDVRLAVEKDSHAAKTYAHNHPNTRVIAEDIANIKEIDLEKRGKTSILFGGPPCQGFSTSNQRTRNSSNETNWIFTEYLRLIRQWKPDWVVFENVKGIVETEKGIFRDKILYELENSGYTCTSGILCAADFGVPQIRWRFFIIGSLQGIQAWFPEKTVERYVTVNEAIGDLPELPNGADYHFKPYRCKAHSAYSKSMRNGKDGCANHYVTNNALHIVERYRYIPQGGNWENIPADLMTNYADRNRCHTGIYRRLRADRPSVVIGNYRKNMLIHPLEDRGLSVREAARLQSFPDTYEFLGSIGFQQQQVANAVPPLLAQKVFEAIIRSEIEKNECEK